MRFLKWTAIVLLLLVAIYILGPHPSTPVYSATMPVVPSTGAALEDYIKSNEAKHKVKPDNEARIVWVLLS